MSEASRRKRDQRRFRLGRWGVLLAILGISTTIGILHQTVPALRTVGVDGLCPFGGVESFWKLITTGAMIKKIEVGSFVLLIGSLGVALVFGRAFCGQFCPLGTLQELMGALRDRLGVRRFEVPRAIDVPARFLKYVVFAVFTYATWRTGLLMIRPYDPWAAYHHILSAELFTAFGIGFAVLLVSLAGSVFFDRFFCKYACPMGAFLALASKAQFFRISRNEHACIDCGLCDAACSMNVDVATAGVVTDEECISCGLCLAACPKEGALELVGRSATAPVVRPSMLLAGTTLGIGVLVAVTTATGAMSFTKPALAAQAGAAPLSASVTGPSSAESDGATRPIDTSLIRGYMTLAEISEATGIPASEFETALGVTPGDMGTPIKELKETYGFDTDAVRRWVADRTDGAYAPRDEARAASDSCSSD